MLYWATRYKCFIKKFISGKITYFDGEVSDTYNRRIMNSNIGFIQLFLRIYSFEENSKQSKREDSFPIVNLADIVNNPEKICFSCFFTFHCLIHRRKIFPADHIGLLSYFYFVFL